MRERLAAWASPRFFYLSASAVGRTRAFTLWPLLPRAGNILWMTLHLFVNSFLLAQVCMHTTKERRDALGETFKCQQRSLFKENAHMEAERKLVAPVSQKVSASVWGQTHTLLMAAHSDENPSSFWDYFRLPSYTGHWRFWVGIHAWITRFKALMHGYKKLQKALRVLQNCFQHFL